MRDLKCVIAGSRSLGSKLVGDKMTQMTLDECPFVEVLFTKCGYSGRIQEIVSGTARGIDNLGEQLAEKHGLELTKFPANWGKFGKRAGFLRNADMAKYCDIAIVIIENKSNGSMNMIQQMKKRKKPVFVFEIRSGEIYESN